MLRTKNSKVICSALASFWFACFSILAPITAHAATYSAASNLTGSQWYIPAQGTGLAGASVVATAATMLGRANPWIAAITLGTPIMKYLLETKDGQNIAIAAKDALQPTPAGWVDSNTPPVSTNAAGGTTETITATSGLNWSASNYGVPPFVSSVQSDADASWTTAAQSQPAMLVNWQPRLPTVCTYHSSTYVTCKGLWEGLPPSQSYTQPGISKSYYGSTGSTCPTGQGWTLSGTTCTRNTGTCPPGYTLSGSSCSLTQPELVKWPSDGKATLTTDGLTMFASPLDPDPLPLGMTVAEIQNGTKLTSLDQYGNYQFTQITPQAGGGLKIDQAVQLTAATPQAQTTTTFNSMTMNNLGNVTNVSTKTVIGDIINITNEGTPATTFPDDYNREATQKAIETELKAASAQAMPDQAQRLTDSAQTNKVLSDGLEEQIKTGQGADKSLWFSWVWTPPIGSCSPSNETVHGVNLNLDYCGPVDLIRDIVGWLFALYGAINIYGQLFRRET